MASYFRLLKSNRNTNIKRTINMTELEATNLDRVNNIKALKTIDDKVNYVYNAYDMGMDRMDEVREYFKMNYDGRK